MDKQFEILEFQKDYEESLTMFLEQCLPESGRALDINSRHRFYKDIDNYFKAFWCMFDQGKVIGSVAVKELDAASCELKSLYLLEQYHGRGYGKRLLEKALTYAKEYGYERIYLDSLSTSTKAIALYRKAGFVDTDRYNQNERSDVFMVLDLKEDKGKETKYMLRLRPYKISDAETIVSWCKDEATFRKWTSDRYESFPITAADMNRKYIDNNGDCIESDNFYPMTAFDENGIVGHLIMRFTDERKAILRLGFVIVDDTKRGKGYGKEMISLSLKYAFEILKVDKVTIGVFENNMPAYYCYKAAGFKDIEAELQCVIFGETWKILEMELTKEEYKDKVGNI